MKWGNDISAALIVAAGQGSRAGGEIPKQFRLIAGQPVLAHAVSAFAMHKLVDAIVVVAGAGQEGAVRTMLADWPVDLIVAGADSRRGSVRAGLEAIFERGGAKQVFIHDAARPFLPPEVVDRLLAALEQSPGAVPVLPVADTLLTATDGVAGDVVDRSSIVRVQTPQAFRFDAILAAHRAWSVQDEATDDAQIMKATGASIALVAGDERLEKLTYPQDFSRAEERLAAARGTRVGMGYDVHRLADGEELWLAGIQIDHDSGLAGHSDADVALHAIVDAVLGALAEGDIGSHFPPSDPQWRGAASSRFLQYVTDRVAARGGVIEHIDVTIICEAPKIGPHRDAMRTKIGEIAGIPLERVSVKATTTERLGFAGRGEGIAAQAVATLTLPALFWTHHA